MSFKEILAKQSASVSAWCTVGAWRSELTPADQIDFDTALESDAQTAVILRAMKEMGYGRTSSTVARHRREECRCVLR